MRQRYQIQRSSWSGWRDYSAPQVSPWTSQQELAATSQVSAPCPQGRVGTYDYRLAVAVELNDGTLPLDDSNLKKRHLAASPPIRTDCGTGAS